MENLPHYVLGGAFVLRSTKTLNNGIRVKGRVFRENTWLCVNRRYKHAACLHPDLCTWGEFLERPTQPWKPHCEAECKLSRDLGFL